jgi:hypothetical protein
LIQKILNYRIKNNGIINIGIMTGGGDDFQGVSGFGGPGPVVLGDLAGFVIFAQR